MDPRLIEISITLSAYSASPPPPPPLCYEMALYVDVI